MAYDNFKPAVWAEKIGRQLEKSLVFGRLANRQYEGTISKDGSTVTVPRVGAATIGDYTGADITFETPAGAKQTIAIDKTPYFALTFDDVDKAQALNGLKGVQVEDAIYRLADRVDTDLAKLESKVKATSRVAVDTTATGKIMTGLRGANKALNKANVPKKGRWMVIDADVEEKLLEELDSKMLPQTADMSTINGYVGKLYGFEIFTSNNVVVATKVHKCLGGTTASFHLAMQLSEIEAGRHEKKFGDFVKGLNLYGCDVAETEAGKTDRLVAMDVTFA